MIGKLTGIVDSVGEAHAIIDVGGVGYHVLCSARSLDALRAASGPVSVLTEMLVSQDAIRLVGFTSEAEREWFRLLQIVQGVGARVALAVLSAFSPTELANAVAVGDKAMISRAQGVGRKLAERIVVELKDKVPAFSAPDAGLARVAGALAIPGSSAAADAVSALVNLGTGQSEAAAAVAQAIRKHGEALSPEKLIRFALRELATP